MEAEPLLANIARGMLRPEDASRSPRFLRHEDSDRPRASSDNTRGSIDQGPGPATLEDTPPKPGKMSTTQPSKAELNALTVEETTDLFELRLQDARKETEHALAGSEGVSDVVKPKLTLDLGHSSIARLPEVVVDMIKTEVERLSLSHNQIWHIPLRISECTQLRYLNIRTNAFREIPRGVYKMPLLEILDISRNKIKKISRDIKNLTSLRVFAIAHNRIEDLPTELCELNKLQILKIAENPLRFRLKRVIETKEAEVSYSEMTDQERETAVTAEVKRYLRESHASNANAATPSENEVGDMNETSNEVPRSLKRALSGRFPVVPALMSADLSAENGRFSPVQGRPPMIPTRSHLRGLSGQNGTVRRSVMPPVANSNSNGNGNVNGNGNGNERNRSNSESVLQASAAARQKRMGMLRKERSDLDSIDETKANRHSHLRGFSHGSALRRGSVSSPGNASSSPSSPRDTRKQRTLFVRRLSSLPEHRNEIQARKPVIEGAKGILYALYQVHPQISSLISAIKGKDGRRSSLEITLYNASTHVDRLNQALEQAHSLDPEDEEAIGRAEDTVHQDCATCIKAYTHVTSQLQDNVRKIVTGTDPRYVRTLMLLLYGSIMEVKNAVKQFGVQVRSHRRQMSSGPTHPIQTIPEEISTPQHSSRMRTPQRDRNGVTLRQGSRMRSDTVLQHSTESLSGPHPPMPPLSAQLPHTAAVPYNPPLSAHVYPHSTGAGRGHVVRSRSNSRHTQHSGSVESSFSSIANTPRSADGFHLPVSVSSTTRLNPMTGMTDAQEETCFEQIFLALTKSYDAALQAIPLARKQFQRCLEAGDDNRQPREVRDLWRTLVHRCKSCLDLSEALQMRLQNMRIKDPSASLYNSGGGRNDPSFWLLAKTFLQSFVDLITEMRGAKELKLLPSEILVALRPVHRASRDVGRLIETSPWRYLVDGVGATSLPVPTASSHHSQHNAQPSGHSSNSTGVNGHLTTNHTSVHPLHSQLPQTHGQQPPLHNGLLATNPSLQMHNGHHLHQFPPFLSTNVTFTPPSSIPLSASTNTSTGTSPMSSQLPATPLSAALGPAAQATIPTGPTPLSLPVTMPNTPASAASISSGVGYGDSFFRGDVFQRADSLLSMPQAAGSVNFLNRK